MKTDHIFVLSFRAEFLWCSRDDNNQELPRSGWNAEIFKVTAMWFEANSKTSLSLNFFISYKIFEKIIINTYLRDKLWERRKICEWHEHKA